MSSMRYTICFGLCMRKNESLHVVIHMTTENKIEWGNLEYDVRMVFSETTGLICMARKCQKAKYRKNEHLIELVRGHTLYNPRVPEHKDAHLTLNTCCCGRQIWWKVQNTRPM